MNKTILPEVLTLEEASEYLRLPRETVLKQAAKKNIPGRKIGDDWRFLKTAIDDWLNTNNSRFTLLSQAGAFADDDSLEDLRKSIYLRRERPETED